jgi:hypothetical protein
MGFQDRHRMITLKGYDLRRACPIGNLTLKISPGISGETGNLRLTHRSQACGLASTKASSEILVAT